MIVELLVVPDCPHERAVGALIRSSLDGIGCGRVQAVTTLINSQQAAERRGFTGSPTILINGVDPFAVPGAPVSVACRLYPGRTGLPDLGRLQRALARAAAEDAPP